ERYDFSAGLEHAAELAEQLDDIVLDEMFEHAQIVDSIEHSVGSWYRERAAVDGFRSALVDASVYLKRLRRDIERRDLHRSGNIHVRLAAAAAVVQQPRAGSKLLE